VPGVLSLGRHARWTARKGKRAVHLPRSKVVVQSAAPDRSILARFCKAKFVREVPYDSDPTRSNRTTGINLRDLDRRAYRMTTAPSREQRDAAPYTLRIVLHQ
jgi:hypothetical protein